jgi:hypothetical protein
MIKKTDVNKDKLVQLKSLKLFEITEHITKYGIPKKGEAYTDGIDKAILARIDKRTTSGFPVANLSFKFSDRKELVTINDVPNLSPEEVKKEQDLIQENRDAKIESRSVGFRRISYVVKEMTGKDLSKEEVNKLCGLEKERGKLFNEAEVNTVVIAGVEKAIKRIKLFDSGNRRD